MRCSVIIIINSEHSFVLNLSQAVVKYFDKVKLFSIQSVPKFALITNINALNPQGRPKKDQRNFKI